MAHSAWRQLPGRQVCTCGLCSAIWAGNDLVLRPARIPIHHARADIDHLERLARPGPAGESPADPGLGPVTGRQTRDVLDLAASARPGADAKRVAGPSASWPSAERRGGVSSRASPAPNTWLAARPGVPGLSLDPPMCF
jgi:hypothetical protein